MYDGWFIHGGCELDEQEGGRVSPEMGVAVHQDVGSIFCGEFGCYDSEHVRMAAEMICEKEDVSIIFGPLSEEVQSSQH